MVGIYLVLGLFLMLVVGYQVKKLLSAAAGNFVGVLVVICALLYGCGPAVKDAAHTQFTTISIVNQITLHYDSELTALDRSECEQAAYYHDDAFRNSIFPVVQSAVAAGGAFIVILPTPGPVDVYVYKSAYLNAPYANQVKGWVDFDDAAPPIRQIHIVAGNGNILPGLTKLLTKSYFPSVPAYTVTFPGLPGGPMTFGAYVEYISESIEKLLRFIRNIP